MVSFTQWATRRHYEEYLAWRTEAGLTDEIGEMLTEPMSIRYFDEIITATRCNGDKASRRSQRVPKRRDNLRRDLLLHPLDDRRRRDELRARKAVTNDADAEGVSAPGGSASRGARACRRRYGPGTLEQPTCRAGNQAK